jgi:hypothetical protein
MVYRYVVPLDGFIPYKNNNLEDSGEMSWNLWFVTESILHGQNPFITDMVFFPVGTNLGTHTLIAGWFPIAAIVKLVTGGSDFYPIYSFNIIVFLSYLFLASFTFLSLRKIGLGAWPAIIPAFGYAFCSFYYWHWKHLNLMAMFAAPLLFYLGLRLWDRPSRRRAVFFAVAFSWSVYLTEMMIFIAMALVAFFTVALLLPSLRRPLFTKLKTLGAINAVLSALIVILVVSPFLYFYSISEIEAPNRGFFSSLAANAAALFLPAGNGTTLYGALFEPIASHITKGLGGREVFLGFPMILFLIVGLWGRKSAAYWFSFVLGLFFISLSFGPTLQFLNVDTKIPMPYNWLMTVPPFTQNRCPVRIALIGFFFLTPIIAFGLERTDRNVRRIFGSKPAFGLLALIFIWTLAETYTSPPQARIIYTVDKKAVAEMADGPAISTSLPFRACNQVVFQIFHKKPIAEFCWARLTAAQRSHYGRLRSSLDAGPARFVDVLKEIGFKNIIVDNRLPFVEVDAFRKSSLKTIEIVPHPKRAVYTAGIDRLKMDLRQSDSPEWLLDKGILQKITLPERVKVSAIEMLADVDDGYRVVLYGGEKFIKTVSLGRIREKGKRGLQWKIQDFKKTEIPYVDRLEIEPNSGVSPYNIAALVLGTL